MTAALSPDPLRTRLRRRDPLAGTVLTVPDGLLAELAATPFDFVWIDLEHSALSLGDVRTLALAAAAADCAALVRLPHAGSELLPPVLDLGVDGVVAPRVETPEEVARLASRLRHPPAGTRGFAHRRWNGWGRATDRDAPACMVQIESGAALARAAEIATAGADALVVGPADLALDLGVPPSITRPELAAAIDAVCAAAHAAGIAAGIATAGDADALAGRCDVVVHSADARLYADAVHGAAARARRALARRPDGAGS